MRFLLSVISFFIITFSASAQQKSNALLWEIKGNGLKKSSYLFGTYHLLTNRFLDSLPKIGEKFNQSEILVGEIIMDKAALAKMEEVMKPGTKTLDQWLSPQDYAFVSAEFQKLIGVGLEPFNTYSPMTVNLLFYQFLLKDALPQDKYKDPELGMDLYFQKYAEQIKKPAKGLETVDVQMQALFGQFSEQRQAEMLVEAVKNTEQNRQEIVQSISCYKKQDIACLNKMIYETNYKKDELDVLLYNRNREWMKDLPAIISAQSSFIAVGTGHLVGENGLIELLRKKGYTLVPVSLK